MKQRLLVMNGQRLIQSEHAGQWTVDKVDKAGAIKPGIYDIHLATLADKAVDYVGLILHADKDHLYQQVGKKFIKHELDSFTKIPDMGSSASIKYEQDRAVVSVASLKLGRKLSR